MHKFKNSLEYRESLFGIEGNDRIYEAVKKINKWEY